MIAAKTMRLQAGRQGSSGWLEPALPVMLAYGLIVFYGVGLLSPLGISAIWAGDGLIVAALLRLDRRAHPCLLLGSLFLNCAAALAVGNPALRSCVLAVVNLMEVLTAYGLTRLA